MTTSDLEYNYLKGVAGLPVVVPHTHTETDINGLLADLASKGAAAHTHPESDIAGLVNALLAKADNGHTHAEGDVGNLSTDLAGKAALAHTHTEANITGLTTDITNLNNGLSGKAASVHTHAEGDVTNLTADIAGINSGLSGKAASVHTHVQADITGLITAIAGLAPKFQYGSVTQMAAVDPTTQPNGAIYVVNNDPTWTYAVYAALGSPQVWTMVAALPIAVHEIASTTITGNYDCVSPATAVAVGSGLSFTAPGYDYRIECEIPHIGTNVINARGTCSLFDETGALVGVCNVPYNGPTDVTRGVQGRIMTERISSPAGTAKTYQLQSARTGENTNTNRVGSDSVTLGATTYTIPIKMRAIPV